jgi:hypothetical protein
MGLTRSRERLRESGGDGRSSTGGEETKAFIDGPLVFGPNDGHHLANARGVGRQGNEVGDGCEMRATGQAVDFNRATVVGVREEVDKAQHSDERHEDAHRNPEP